MSVDQPALVVSSSSATLATVLSNRLGRALHPYEERMVNALTPQGMAKINHDGCSGIALQTTVNDLMIVYERVQRRRGTMRMLLTEEANKMIAKLKRPPTDDELTMFVNVPVPMIRRYVRERRKTGESYNSIIEEFAMQHKYEQLQTDARTFEASSNLPNPASKLPVRVTLLAPTVRPSTPNELAPTMARIGTHKIQIGISPVLLWFRNEEGSDSELEVVSQSRIADLASTPSPKRELAATDIADDNPVKASPQRQFGLIAVEVGNGDKKASVVFKPVNHRLVRCLRESTASEQAHKLLPKLGAVTKSDSSPPALPLTPHPPVAPRKSRRETLPSLPPLISDGFTANNDSSGAGSPPKRFSI